MVERIEDLPEGLYSKKELDEMGLAKPCPYCKSTKVALLIHGSIRQYQCKTCQQYFT